MRLFLATLFGCVLIFVGFSFSQTIRNRNKYSRIVVAGHVSPYPLSGSEPMEFMSLIGHLPFGREEITDEPPDMVFLGYRNGRDKPDEFSVFLKQGVIYEGFFLDAFGERMIGKRSRILVIDNRARYFFKRIKEAQSAYEATWRTDKAPIEECIPLLVPFEECIWKGGQASDNSGGMIPLPAPEEYFVKGFIKIDDSTSKALREKYSWNAVKLEGTSIDKPATPGIADSFVSGGDYLESPDFMREHTRKSSFSNGRIILNPTTGVIYFDLQDL